MPIEEKNVEEKATEISKKVTKSTDAVLDEKNEAEISNTSRKEVKD